MQITQGKGFFPALASPDFQSSLLPTKIQGFAEVPNFVHLIESYHKEWHLPADTYI